MEIRPSFTPFVSNDDHLVRRLAAALLLRWHAVPADVRRRIVEQAGLIENADSETVQLREQIEAFIQRFAASAEA